MDPRLSAPKFTPDGTILVYDPTTGSVIDKVASATPDEVDAAALRARKALPAWRELSVAERAER
ncbi:MAG: aldehyde dehydrogenase family protein, partial [Candidatus Methylomirabilis sp.]|nr:aldehyde dehydrogenase family protein [Deltaproteobacteria bacterium]